MNSKLRASSTKNCVTGRVVRIYRRPWNTHARSTMNERSCQSRSQIASGPPSLTRLTGARINLEGMFLRRSDWVSPTQTPHGTIISLSISSTLIVLIILLGYVGRDDGDQGPTLRDSPRRPIRDLISSGTGQVPHW